ncbi:MAG: endolytic transglycosylase MltG, partial [Atopostipes suicloacalis]|nr:endolytic transglycosylase MltG [Atopostipes suicloacalis]
QGLKPVDADSEEVIEIEIPMGSNKNQIARVLEENELISSSFIYNLYIRLNNENTFQAGTYLMSPSMSLKEIVQYLNEGGSPIMPEPIARLTIPEGLGIEKIGERIEEDTHFTNEDFMELVEKQTFIKETAEKYPALLTSALEASSETRYTLEGYLYPATYEIYEETTLKDLLSDMIEETDRVLSPDYQEINNKELTVHEIMTLASYIEGEGVSDTDRELISGVFYNRLEVGMLLRTDPSVSYALGEHRERISYEDLEIDSPYNTYKYPGIGPGPINNPSESAIEASIYPAETDYLFFLADLKTGEVYFSKDYDQHLKYKKKYLDGN